MEVPAGCLSPHACIALAFIPLGGYRTRTTATGTCTDADYLRTDPCPWAGDRPRSAVGDVLRSETATLYTPPHFYILHPVGPARAGPILSWGLWTEPVPLLHPRCPLIPPL